jgi:hypothetical protein
MKIKLTNVRLSFPELFEAKSVNGEGKPAFSGSFLIDPKDPQVKMINEAIEAVARMQTENIQDTIVGRTLTETTMILQDARRVFESMTVRVPDSE